MRRSKTCYTDQLQLGRNRVGADVLAEIIQYFFTLKFHIMFSSSRSVLLLLGSLFAVAWPQMGFADMIFISNSSFEAPDIGAGMTTSSSPGWVQGGTGGGVWDITSTPTFWNTVAPNGSQVGFVTGAKIRDFSPSGTANLTQNLGVNLLDNATYTLSGFVGIPIGSVGGTDFFVEVFAGNNLLATLQGGASFGSFDQFQFNFNAVGSAGSVGQVLSIRLGTNLDRVAFDSLALSVTAVPEPTSALLCALASGMLVFKKRRTLTYK